MPIVSRLRSVWRTLAHRERLDRELDDELQSAVEILAARLSADGTDSSAARRAAERAIGGPWGLQPVRDTVRENRVGAVLDVLRLDTRDAWRRLRHAPCMTATVVATLGIGIGATTAPFSVVHAMLVAPLPYRDADRLAMVWLDMSAAAPRGVDLSRLPLAGQDLRKLREGTRTFEGFGAIRASGTVAITDGAEPEQLRRAFVTASFFDVLGVTPALGRSFVCRRGGHWRTSVLGRCWSRTRARQADSLAEPGEGGSPSSRSPSA